MLPSPAELREQSAFYRDAAREAATTETKQRLAAYSLILAQVAEAIERNKQSAEVEHLRRILADALVTLLQTPLGELESAAIAARDRGVGDARSRIKAWRMRAEELRTTADHFVVPSAQESMRRAAANYEQMADRAEAMVTGKPKAPGEKAG